MSARLEFLFPARHEPGGGVNTHRHGCYELVYYAKGRGRTRIGDRNYEYREGEYALIRPGTRHDERHEAETEVLCLGFAPMRDTPLPEGVFSDKPPSDEDNAMEPLLPLLLKMAKEMRNKEEAYMDMLDLLTSELVLVLQRRRPRGEDATTHAEEKFRYALNYMNENFHQRVDFHALAAMAGYSFDRYRHLFKEQTGMSPGRYVLCRRIGHARALLRGTKLGMAEIAANCGFAGDSQFCSQFKRETGMSPGAYRKSSYS
ncbi:AraC family transcriptional regulator [Cohnella sp. JJ-181]|uniref:AraC family transcriptional regulator n=1 Tax=Cohnella rhizoplanae TaxID=2974897 RepID=UPI0022FF976A|nr:AraC family transcriptional regulator [Cohnella sp. JJ-181]CAI6076566.1 HTH-type transcriptional activator RhaS [Cohnella sp. JJ-181]